MTQLAQLVKPSKLNRGDSVAAISLSWGGPGSFPYRFEIGKRQLEENFGLHVIPTTHALKSAEEGIEPTAVTRFMRNLAAQGILSRLKGILFSKPGGKTMTSARFSEYDQALVTVFEEYQLPLIPIVTGMDFGHSAPMWILPYGTLAEINSAQKTVSILESGVSALPKNT